MMGSAQWHGEFVADLAPERTRLGKPKVMRIGGCAATYEARLAGDKLAVILVAQTDGLWRNAATASVDVRSGCRGRRIVSWIVDPGITFGRDDLRAGLDGLLRPAIKLLVAERRDLGAEANFDRLRVGGCEGVLTREAAVCPSGGLVGRLKRIKLIKKAIA